MSDAIKHKGKKQKYLNFDILEVFQGEELSTAEVQKRLKLKNGYSKIAYKTVLRKLNTLCTLGDLTKHRVGTRATQGYHWSVVEKPVIENKPKITITSIHENHFVILNKCRVSAKARGWTAKKMTQFVRKAINKKPPSFIDSIFEQFDVKIEP